ncbi:GNAT family N-acetyltransferase [Haladaptatus salinisoli]|uniref:GNAT family N-acetyltransferase n=1 Tax=Haladaptatus salinisoli TaxID=2884876 RepID=UPI001D09EDA3|nr:GNAT family N-acetyltransferase [Haladaptatus salinisoli]
MATTGAEELATTDDWATAVPVLRQLWTDADESEILSWRDEDGYRLLGLYADDELAGVAGVCVQRVLHHARHAWIHDFVVDEAHRGEGYGTTLLSEVEEWARERGCEYVALAARLENEPARRFYEENGVERWGYVMETEL